MILFTEFFKGIHLSKIRHSMLLAVEVASGPLTAMHLPGVKSAFTSATLSSKEQPVPPEVWLALNSESKPVLARVHLGHASSKLAKLRVTFCCL